MKWQGRGWEGMGWDGVRCDGIEQNSYDKIFSNLNRDLLKANSRRKITLIWKAIHQLVPKVFKAQNKQVWGHQTPASPPGPSHGRSLLQSQQGAQLLTLSGCRLRVRKQRSTHQAAH